jgi:hypothetical protein
VSVPNLSVNKINTLLHDYQIEVGSTRTSAILPLCAQTRVKVRTSVDMARVDSRQLLEQRFCLFQVASVETFAEPPVDHCQQVRGRRADHAGGGAGRGS